MKVLKILLLILFVAHAASAQQVLMLQRKTSPRHFLVVPTPKSVSLKTYSGHVIKGQLTAIEKNEFVIDGSQSFPFDSVKLFCFYNPNPYKYFLGTITGIVFIETSVLIVLIASDDRVLLEAGRFLPLLLFYDMLNFTTSYLMFNLKRQVDLRNYNLIEVNSPEGNNMRYHNE